MVTRDMSKAAFEAKLKKYGFTDEGFMGYYRLPLGSRHTCVSIFNFNVGRTRREQLAYLIRMAKREVTK